MCVDLYCVLFYCVINFYCVCHEKFFMLQIQIVNGVILIAWREKVLERQIDYGAKLGHVVLSMARMELNNFFKHVIPVADYFDQRGMLMAVRKMHSYFFFFSTIAQTELWRPTPVFSNVSYLLPSQCNPSHPFFLGLPVIFTLSLIHI